MQNEAYAKEYNAIIEQKQAKIDAATQEVAEVSEVYANGYLQRSEQNDSFYNTLKEYMKKQHTLEEEYTKKIEQIKNGELWYVTNTYQALQSENETYVFHQNNTWKEMYKNMSNEQAKELGIWLAQVAQTELYGGKINDETKEIVEGIMESYDSMPQKTKEAMKNAMSPMLNEMQNSEPSLYAKASGIAEGILTRLKKSFDIHSPSRETRDIFQNVMKGAELGLKDEEKRLNNEIDKIARKIKSDFNNMLPNMQEIKQSVIEQTRTIFTTPQITFNVQELDETKLQQCFNYVNRKFGSAY